MNDEETFFTDEELQALAKRVHKTARDKGWWEVDDQGRCINWSLDEKLVLIITELAEAFEEWRRPDVDVKTIYTNVVGPGITNRFETKKIPWDELGSLSAMLFRMGQSTTSLKPEGFPIEMADAYIRILDLLEAAGMTAHVSFYKDDFSLSQHIRSIIWYVNTIRGLDELEPRLNAALSCIEMCCRDFEVDLRRALEIKAAYNDTRPVRHGGKRA